jgi:hypothetical protein
MQPLPQRQHGASVGDQGAYRQVGMAAWVEKPSTAKGGHLTRFLSLNLNPTPDTTDTTLDADDGTEPNDLTQLPDTTPTHPFFLAEIEGCVSSVRRQANSNGQPEGEAKLGGLCQALEVVSVPDFIRERR